MKKRYAVKDEGTSLPVLQNHETAAEICLQPIIAPCSLATVAWLESEQVVVAAVAAAFAAGVVAVGEDGLAACERGSSEEGVCLAGGAARPSSLSRPTRTSRSDPAPTSPPNRGPTTTKGAEVDC